MNREDLKAKILRLISDSNHHGVTKDEIVAHAYEDAYAIIKDAPNSWWATVAAHNLIDKLVQQLRKDGLIIYDRHELVWRSVRVGRGQILKDVFDSLAIDTDIEDANESAVRREVWQRVADEYERRKKYGGRNV